MLSNINKIYSLYPKEVRFKHVHCNELLYLAKSLELYRKEYKKNYENDILLTDVYNMLTNIFFNICRSILPYCETIVLKKDSELFQKLRHLEGSYLDFFGDYVKPVIKYLVCLSEFSQNYLFNYLSKSINEINIDHKVAIITKRALTQIEKDMINTSVIQRNIKFFTENSYRKSVETFDSSFFIGTANYFGRYATRVLKARVTYFVSYDMFTNTINKNNPFYNVVPQKEIIDTIDQNISYGNNLTKVIPIEIENENSIHFTVQKILEDQNKNNISNDIFQEASIVYLENDHFVFVATDSKVRIYSPDDKSNCVQRISFRELEEDSYLIISNERDTKLIATVADKVVLKKDAMSLRTMQKDWKNKLRSIVERYGITNISEVLMTKYHMTTASPASVRFWCNEESICPTELRTLLVVLGYENDQIENVYGSMKKIQKAHIIAGKLITKKLMHEMTSEIDKELEEKGWCTFESNEFDGASFNIERITAIDHSKYDILPHNILKPFKIQN